MKNKITEIKYDRESFVKYAASILDVIKDCVDKETARNRLLNRIEQIYDDRYRAKVASSAHELIRVRDCFNAFRDVFNIRSENRSGFSLVQALWDISQERERNDLQPAFFAEMINWAIGLIGKHHQPENIGALIAKSLDSHEKAVIRSEALDQMSEQMDKWLTRYGNGLDPSVQECREKRREDILKELSANENDWSDWRWQVKNVIMDAETLKRIVRLSESEFDAIITANKNRLPFGITPYYASLMDDDESGRDIAIRRQVIPSANYVNQMSVVGDEKKKSCDFMLEADTSPIDLITRRYPGIVIFKPYNTCPQICVYCQRNWEISRPLDPNALAPKEKIEKALSWIAERKSIREVLLTGGDPMLLEDSILEYLLGELSKIDHVEMIRIGTRTPVTMPMRFTKDTVAMLAKFREIARRDLAVVTHFEHPYEVTIQSATAIDYLKRAGISVYNQQVFTFYVSRRYETALLRLLLRKIGVDPYYTFTPKGKEETNDFRVPIARILQEQKEEARLLPGLRRTDEAVYNVPGLGKNYLRARQHRDLLTVMPDGSRIYEFHPWEKNIAECNTYVGTDVPILDYLNRLKNAGENIEEYSTIWYYF